MIIIRTVAQKEASKRYKAKSIQKLIQYYPKELDEWEKINTYLTSKNLSYQQYVKDLIREDMKKNGYLQEENTNGGIA